MRAALTPDMLATDLAEYLVRKGVRLLANDPVRPPLTFRSQVPFRETHHISGSAVRLAESHSVPLSSLSFDQLRSLSPLFEPDVEAVFDFETSVERRDVTGGTSRRSVVEQVERVRKQLSSGSSA